MGIGIPRYSSFAKLLFYPRLVADPPIFIGGLEFVHLERAMAPTSPLWQQGIRLAGLIRRRLGVKPSQIPLFSLGG